MGMAIEKITDAKTSSTIQIKRSSIPITFSVAGVLVAETIAVNEVDEAGAVLPLRDADGVAITFTATSPPLSIYSPIDLQFVKPETTNPVGVKVSSS